MHSFTIACVGRAIGRLSFAALAVAPVPCKSQGASATATEAGALTLRQVFDRAATQPRLEAALARAAAANGSRATAGTYGNPVLSYQVDNAPIGGAGTPPMARESMMTATLPLEFLYQRSSRVQRADANVRAAEADVVTTRQRLLVDAARAFHRVALAEEVVAIALNLTAWLDTLVSYNRARAREGAAAEADLLRAELERDRAMADAAMLDAELARARADLVVFLGVDRRRGPAASTLSAPFTIPDVAGMQEVIARFSGTASLDSARATPVAAAMPDRADLRAARERVAAAAAGVTNERTMLIRQLGATVGTKSSAGTTSLMAGISVPLPLFDRNRGEIARASSERDAAMHDLAATERDVRAELAGSLDAAVLLTRRAEALAQPDVTGAVAFLAKADESRRIALGAYREGAIPLVQVLDAARVWGESRAAFYRLLAAQRDGVVALLAAFGVDLTTWDMRTSHITQ